MTPRTLRLVTWNVLHRVHGMNWGEGCLAAFPDEGVRTARIAARVAGWLGAGIDVVCLQEVSGDQLASLTSALPGVQRFTQRAPRVPRLRVAAAPLGDASEQLVTLVAAGDAQLAGAHAFSEDDGKGVLSVQLLRGPLVLNTHVTHGARGAGQLGELATLARAAGRAVVLGDFNAPAPVVAAALGPGFVFADVEGQGPTRVATGPYPDGKVIDHLVVLGGRVSDATVLRGDGLSDHHPVSATVSFDG